MRKPRAPRLFSDPFVKEEMLELRRQGYSFSDIARKYGADHTTIIHHCQAAGLALTMSQQKEVRAMIREGLSVKQVGKRLKVDANTILLYCHTNGVPGSMEFPTKKLVKHMELLEGQMHAQERRDAKRKENMINKILFKTDENGVTWRTDESGKWECLGREDYNHYKPKGQSQKEKSEALNRKRQEMLKY